MMKALTFTAVSLLTATAFSQDMGGMMAAQSAMDASNAAAAAQAAQSAAQAAAIQQQMLAQQQLQADAQEKLKAQQNQDGQLKLPTPNPTPTPTTRVIQPSNNQAVAPDVFYGGGAGGSTVSPRPLEVEVPVYKPVETKTSIQQIYSEIKDSQFYIEFKPLTLSYVNYEDESNEENNGVPYTETESTNTRFRLLPLTFKGGFENQNWGSFAIIQIADGEDKSDLVVYAKTNIFKIGGGISLASIDKERTFKVNGGVNKKTDTSETDFSIYFYMESLLQDDANMRMEGRLFAGGTYSSSQDTNLKLSGASAFIRPELDVFNKINKNLMIGFGGSIYYSRFTGDVSYTGTSGNSGVGDTFALQVDFIKTRFLF